MKLKLMTYNIAAGRDYSNGPKPISINPDACTSVIREEMPDICALNEVDYKLPRSNRIKLAKYIGDSLGYESAFAPAVTWGVGTYGNGFISRHSIKEIEVFPIPDPADKSEPVYYETRVILHTVVDFGGTEVDVFVSHFGLAKTEQESAVKTLVSLIKDATHPVILMGDFNVLPDNPVLDPIRELLDDTFDVLPEEEAAGIWTYPSELSLLNENGKKLKIDYIFVSHDIKTESVVVKESPVSDHKPYIATVELP